MDDRDVGRRRHDGEDLQADPDPGLQALPSPQEDRDDGDVLGQSYFWTDEWQEGEREAEADIEAGRVTSHDSADEAIADLLGPGDAELLREIALHFIADLKPNHYARVNEIANVIDGIPRTPDLPPYVRIGEVWV